MLPLPLRSSTIVFKDLGAVTTYGAPEALSLSGGVLQAFLTAPDDG